jgi:hypothetical protein
MRSGVQVLDYVCFCGQDRIENQVRRSLVETQKTQPQETQPQETQPQEAQASPAPEEPRKTRALWERVRDFMGFGKDGEKTGLDLLQVLAAVSIPVAVVIMGAIFTASQSRSQQQAEEQRGLVPVR